MPLPAFFEMTGLKPVNPNMGVNGVYYIQGELSQIVHIILRPNQQIQCEPGAMIYTADNVKQKVKIGGIGRMLSGESIFKSLYLNESPGEAYVGVAAGFPATIIPMDLSQHGGAILCKRDAYLASIDSECQVSIAPMRAGSAGACLCAGVPMFMQRIQTNQIVFLAAHGTIVTKILSAGEKLVVDTTAVVAVTTGVTIDIQFAGSCLTCCCGGEGLFNTTLTGPGQVWIGSMPMEKLRALFPQKPPQQKKKKGVIGTMVANA